jgi:hypothetical protein
MIENRVLRETFGSKRKEVRGDWGKYYNDEHLFYVLQNGTRAIKWKRMRKVGHEVQ